MLISNSEKFGHQWTVFGLYRLPLPLLKPIQIPCALEIYLKCGKKFMDAIKSTNNPTHPRIIRFGGCKTWPNFSEPALNLMPDSLEQVPSTCHWDVSTHLERGVLASLRRRLRRFSVHNSITKQLQDWRMMRITLGVASSPFLATQVLIQWAVKLPEAAAIAKSNLSWWLPHWSFGSGVGSPP